MLRFHYPWASVPAIHLRQVESQEMSCYGAFAAHCLYVKGGVISQKPQGSSASLGHDMTTSRPVMPNFKRYVTVSMNMIVICTCIFSLTDGQPLICLPANHIQNDYT